MSEVTVTQTKPGREVEYRGRNSRSKRTVKVDREWDVRVDGVLIGHVVYRMLTRERKTQGKMYVYSRWQSPGWESRTPGSWLGREAFSKRVAVETLVRNYESEGKA